MKKLPEEHIERMHKFISSVAGDYIELVMEKSVQIGMMEELLELRKEVTYLKEKDTKYNVYLASSWRNESFYKIVKWIEQMGYTVYDFKNKEHAFRWSDIDENWENWTLEEYIKYLEHPLSIAGFNNDFNALNNSKVCILLLPCGRSAHLEAGYAIGRGIPTYILAYDNTEPELMYKMANGIGNIGLAKFLREHI